MPRTMYDSIRADGMPPDGDIYACYTDGLYANEAAVRSRFPGKPIVRISALGRADADVIDIEPGCVWPPSAAASWLAARPGAAVYCGLANLAAVVAALGTDHPYWVAHYTNRPHVCSQARCRYDTAGARIVGTQYGGDSNAGGYHFDVSAIYDDAWMSDSHMAQGGGIPIGGADLGGALQEEEDWMDKLTPDEQHELLDGIKNLNATLSEFTTRQGILAVRVPEGNGDRSGEVWAEGPQGWVHIGGGLHDYLSSMRMYAGGAPRDILPAQLDELLDSLGRKA